MEQVRAAHIHPQAQALRRKALSEPPGRSRASADLSIPDAVAAAAQSFALCQQKTHASQQIIALLDHLVGARE
jgi:hypothetical protein